MSYFICILTVPYFFQHATPPHKPAHRKILTKQVCTTILTEIALLVNLFLAALSNKTVFDELAAASRKVLRISTSVVNIYLKCVDT